MYARSWRDGILAGAIALFAVSADGDPRSPKGRQASTERGGNRATLFVELNRSSSDGYYTDVIGEAGKSIFYRRFLPTTGSEIWVGNGRKPRLELLRDVAVGAASANPRAAITLGESLLFTTSDSVNGQLLWASDGTPKGTRPLAGGSSSAPSGFDGFFVVGDRAYFRAETPEFGLELYATDGTAAGTRRVSNFETGSPDFAAQDVAHVPNGFMFTAFAGSRRYGLFVFDSERDLLTRLDEGWPIDIRRGSAAYLRERDIYLVPTDDPDEGPGLFAVRLDPPSFRRLTAIGEDEEPALTGNLFVRGNEAFFSNSSRERGSSLWVTDGTREGTRRLGPNEPESTWSGIHREYASTRNGLVLSVTDRDHGREPWVTDGTREGTKLLLDARPGWQWFRPVLVHVRRGIAYYRGTPDGRRGALLRTDGTSEGSWFVKEWGGDLEPLAVVPRRWRRKDFLMSYGVRSDGTQKGTGLVVRPPPPGGGSGFGCPHVIGDRLLFRATDGDGVGIWWTDGSPKNIARLVYASSETRTSLWLDGSCMTGFEGRAFFTADLDPVRRGRLFETDGSSEGTALLFDGRVGQLSGTDSEIYFTQEDLYENRLWYLNPRTDELEVVVEAGEFSRITLSEPLAGGRGVFFRARRPGRREGLWFASGPRAEPVLVTPEAEVRPGRALLGGDRLVFNAGATFFDFEPWISDGTLDGTHPLGDLMPGRYGSSPARFLSHLDDVFFTAFSIDESGEPIGRELFVVDDRTETIRLVRDIAPGIESSEISAMISFGELLVFRANDGVHGSEIWRSDGTEQGTFMIRDIRPGSTGSDIQRFHLVDDKLLFAAHDGVHGDEVWMTDGTPEGTHLLIDQVPGTGSSSPRDFQSFGEHVYFVGRDDEIGSEPLRFPRSWLEDPDLRFSKRGRATRSGKPSDRSPALSR